METIVSRYRNLIILLVVLFTQLLGLAVQVRRNTDEGPTRLIRVWAISAVTPLEKGVVHTRGWFREAWTNYIYLRNVRRENEELQREIQRMRLENARLTEDAVQSRRLQALFDFKEQFIHTTVAAQVIGTSGSEQSRLVFIDKGTEQGIHRDMAVITPDGIVGKIRNAERTTAGVLLINDQSSGVGALLESSRLRGILAGTPAGELVLQYVMSDETVKPGERILTSGGDRVFPRGLPIGVVTQVSPGRDLFLNIRVRPVASLERLDEVLVITKVEERPPDANEAVGPVRAADILAERLPTVKPRAQPEGAAPGLTTKPPASGATNPTPQLEKPKNQVQGTAPVANPNKPPAAKPKPTTDQNPTAPPPSPPPPERR